MSAIQRVGTWLIVGVLWVGVGLGQRLCAQTRPAVDAVSAEVAFPDKAQRKFSGALDGMAEVARVEMRWGDGSRAGSWTIVPNLAQRKFALRAGVEDGDARKLGIEAKGEMEMKWWRVASLSVSKTGQWEVSWDELGANAGLLQAMLSASACMCVGKDGKDVGHLAFAVPAEGKATVSLTRKEAAKIELAGLPKGGRGVRVHPAAADALGGWTFKADVSADGTSQGQTVIMAHRQIGVLRLELACAEAGVIEVTLGNTDGAAELERLAALAAKGGITAVADQLQGQLTDIQGQIDEQKGSIENLETQEASVRKENSRVYTSSFHGIATSEVRLSSYGQQQIAELDKNIKDHQQTMAPLVQQRVNLQNELKKVNPAAGGKATLLDGLAAVSPLALVVDMPVGNDKAMKLGSVDLSFCSQGGAPAAASPAPPVAAKNGIHWTPTGFDVSEAPATNPVRRACGNVWEQQTGEGTGYVGVGLGARVQNTDDDAYGDFVRTQQRALERMWPFGNCVRAKEKVSRIAFETLTAEKGTAKAVVYVGVQSGHCVAYWFVGPVEQLTGFRDSVGQARIEDVPARRLTPPRE